MEQTNRITDILEKSDLNWGVRTEAITTERGEKSCGILLGGYSAIVRDDTNTPLSVRSDGYHPYQNYQLIELLDRVSQQTGLELKKGGHFKGGARVYIQLKSNDLRLGNDKVEGYLTGINSFDGSTSLAFGPSNITISCMNSFFASFREMDTKIRHTKNMVIKVDEVCKRLEGVLQEERKVFDNIVQLSETRFDDLFKDNIIKKLFNIDKNIDLKDHDSIPSVTRNKLGRFYIDLNGEIQQKGDNMWGLFSGVTKYTTHSLTKDDNTETKMFGVYGKREQGIFNEMVELV
jgi:phage/plasmid-like protein (TIGR03299 family)